MKRRGRPPVQEITAKQRRTLAILRELINKHGIPPTVQELATILGVSPASVHQQLQQLASKGYVRREPRKARSLEIIRLADPSVPDVVSVPIVGEVAAGPAMLAEENIIGEVLVEASVVGRSRCFALKVVGDSMVKGGIRDGDLVVVRQQPVAESGDVVVALLGEEATVKRLRITDEGVELRPENPRYQPRRVGPEDDLRIAGKVIAVRRHGGSAKEV